MVVYSQVLIPKICVCVCVCVCEKHVNKLKPTMLSRPKRDHTDLLKILKLRYKHLLLYTLRNSALAGATLIFVFCTWLYCCIQQVKINK